MTIADSPISSLVFRIAASGKVEISAIDASLVETSSGILITFFLLIEIKHRLIAERAVVMLTTTDQTVETIASSLGLCSSAYLRRILKKQTGGTPSQIRKEAKFM